MVRMGGRPIFIHNNTINEPNIARPDILKTNPSLFFLLKVNITNAITQHKMVGSANTKKLFQLFIVSLFSFIITDPKHTKTTHGKYKYSTINVINPGVIYQFKTTI